ncbi:hypothetical protein VCHC19A1_1569, partial [Vibrio cholerae HC-19A1]|jgi:hypothetical protein
MKRS